jgi:hypothetical protein
MTRWLSYDITLDEIRDFLLNKATHPLSLPVTREELELEESIIRQILKQLVKKITNNTPGVCDQIKGGLPLQFEPILVAGSLLTETALNRCMLMLLDGLQPTGITTFLLDHNNLVSALGATIDENPLIAVQVLGTNTVQNLGTVISAVGNSKLGSSICQGQIEDADGQKSTIDITSGTIQVIPLESGEIATLQLQPIPQIDIGMGSGRGGTLKVSGGALGIIFDARGRPYHPHRNKSKMRTQVDQWLKNLKKEIKPALKNISTTINNQAPE